MEGAPHLHRSLDGRADTGIVAGAQCWWQHIKSGARHMYCGCIDLVLTNGVVFAVAIRCFNCEDHGMTPCTTDCKKLKGVRMEAYRGLCHQAIKCWL